MHRALTGHIELLLAADAAFVTVRRFHTDPSGTFVKYGAKAIGSGSEGAQTALQEGYRCALLRVVILLLDDATRPISVGNSRPRALQSISCCTK